MNSGRRFAGRKLSAARRMRRKSMSSFEDAPLGSAGKVTLGILVGFLFAAIGYAIKEWRALSGVSISGFGWGALLLGVALTVGLGAVLMRLVYHSNRHGFDR